MEIWNAEVGSGGADVTLPDHEPAPAFLRFREEQNEQERVHASWITSRPGPGLGEPGALDWESVMVIGEEIAYFHEHRARLLIEHKGQFALIKGSQLWGVYQTAEEACEAGSQRFGSAPFLVAHVTETFLVGVDVPWVPFGAP